MSYDQQKVWIFSNDFQTLFTKNLWYVDSGKLFNISRLPKERIEVSIRWKFRLLVQSSGEKLETYIYQWKKIKIQI